MILTMVNGDDACCGTMTSGGTESVLLACLAYRCVAACASMCGATARLIH